MKPSIKIYKIDQYLEIQTLGFIPDFKQKLQEITLPDWNISLKRWIIEFRPEYIEQLKNTFNVIQKKENNIKIMERKTEQIRMKKSPFIHQLNAEGILQCEKFTSWLQSKRYSPNTIKTYTDALRSFLSFFNEKPISIITNEDVVTYNNEYILKNNFSASYQSLRTVKSLRI